MQKVAIYGTRKWQQVASKIGGWFIAGESRFFEDADAALERLRPIFSMYLEGE